MALLDHYSKNTLPAEGVYTARIAAYIETGVAETRFGDSYQAKCTIELCEPTRKAGQPIIIFKTIFNQSMRSQKFRDFLKAVTNRAELSGFDLKDLVVCQCEVVVTHRESEAGIFADAEVSRYKGTAKLPPLMSDPVFFSLHPSDFDADVLEALPEKLRDKIKRGPTYKDLMLQRALADKPAADIIDDDIPF
jgi:hypothetical protein